MNLANIIEKVQNRHINVGDVREYGDTSYIIESIEDRFMRVGINRPDGSVRKMSWFKDYAKHDPLLSCADSGSEDTE